MHLLSLYVVEAAGLPFGGMHGIPGPPPLPLQQHQHPSEMHDARSNGPPQPRVAPTEEQNALGECLLDIFCFRDDYSTNF